MHVTLLGVRTVCQVGYVAESTNEFALALPEFIDHLFVVVSSVASPFHAQLELPSGTGMGLGTLEGSHSKNIWAEKLVVVSVFGLPVGSVMVSNGESFAGIEVL